MTYERFSQLWDALITNRPGIKHPITTNMSPETLKALIAYGQGDKTEINRVKRMLGR